MEISELSVEVSDNLDKFTNGLMGVFSEFEQHALITQEEYENAQDSVAINGLPLEELELLQDIGFTNTDIERVTESALSLDDYDRISSFSETFANLSYFFNVQENLYIQSSVTALNNSITMNVDYLNEVVSSATPIEQKNLRTLKDQLENAVNNSNWFKAEQIAHNLMNYSRYIITQTNNNSYNELYEYGNFIIQYIKLMLSLDLKVSLEEIDIQAGISEEIRISVTNKENEQCTCIISLDTEFPEWFEYNTTFELNPYETKTISIKILISTSPSIPIGTYPVNISIFREDNPDIRDNAQILIIFTEDDTTPPEISIEYHGLKTDEDPGFWDVLISDQHSSLRRLR